MSASATTSRWSAPLLSRGAGESRASQSRPARRLLRPPAARAAHASIPVSRPRSSPAACVDPAESDDGWRERRLGDRSVTSASVWPDSWHAATEERRGRRLASMAMADHAAALAGLVLRDHADRPVRLGDLWAERPVALVWLRHYG